MWTISSALGEWHSAIFSTVPERESWPWRQFSACSRFANHEWITARTRITSWQFSEWVVAVPLPAGMLAAELSWTEKGTNQSMKWSRSLRSLKWFVRLNDTFATDTTLAATLFMLWSSRNVFVHNKTSPNFVLACVRNNWIVRFGWTFPLTFYHRPVSEVELQTFLCYSECISGRETVTS